MDEPKGKHAFHFDGTINVANIFSLGAAVLACVIAFMQQDKRITVLEEFRVAQAQRDKTQDEDIKERLDEIRQAQREMSKELRELSHNLVRAAPPPRAAPSQVR